MAFRGWPVEALEFFEGLEVENSKAYWQRNKAVYESAVRAPMEALLAELAPDFGEGRIFRPYRDVRFSSDKSPYKTNIGAMIGVKAGGLDATGHDALKTAPKGYPKDHPRIELLRYKGLITWKEWPAGAWLGTRKAKDRVVQFLEASKPLNGWLRKHVGPSTLPDRGR